MKEDRWHRKTVKHRRPVVIVTTRLPLAQTSLKVGFLAVLTAQSVSSMIDEDRYCGDVLIQLAAVESAVKAVSREVMQDHLESCVVDRIQSGDTEVIDEVMDLFKRFM